MIRGVQLMAVSDRVAEGSRSVLGRAFRVLDCFTSGAEMSVSAIVQETGLPAATVHRLLASLVEWGAVEHFSHGRYRLGARIWNLGVGAPQIRLLREIAQPYLVDLHVRTRGTVYLAIREGGESVIADRITTVRRTAATKRITRRRPLHETGAGRVILAFSPDAWQDMLDRVADDPTMTEPLRQLERLLASIRDDRVAISLNDGIQGRHSVAAPIFGLERLVLGSIAVAFPDERISNPATIASAVVETAETISREFLALG